MKAPATHMLKASEMLANNAHQSIDIGYIKTLLFPELYNADIPQPMSTQSYCRFSDKKEVTFTSGGSGMLLWYPKTNIGPQLWVRAGINPQTAAPLSPANWKSGGWQDYSSFFSQTCLVAGSISLQYIGQMQNESGYFVASQIYGITPSAITSTDIENGQFRVMAKPGDGVRSIYLPKDQSDFSYYNCGWTLNNGGTFTIVRTKNSGRNPDNDIIDMQLDATAAGWIEAAVPQELTNNKYGANPRFRYNTDADCIAIFWSGLTAQNNDLRIDAVRKFNGFPLAQQRDVLDLIKPKKVFDPKKTIDVIAELQMAVPQLAGHSLKAMDRVSEQIQENIPNLGDLYNEGLLKEGSSLEGFTNQLQMLSGNEGNVASIGRIYE